MAPLHSEKDQSSAKAEKEAKAVRSARSATSKKTKKPKKADHSDILNAALNINFANAAEAQEFGSQYKEKIEGKSKGRKARDHILHILAKKSGWKEGVWWTDKEVKQFLNWALGPLGGHHDLLEEKNGDNYTPLHLALIDHHTAFVDAVLQNDDLVNLGTVLAETCQYGNSLHVAIRYKLEFSSLNLMVNKCDFQMFTKGQTETNDTPLHTCMSMDMEEDDETDVETSSEDEDENDDEDDDDDEAMDRKSETKHHYDKNSGFITIQNAPEKTTNQVDSKSSSNLQRRKAQTPGLQPVKSMSFPLTPESTFELFKVVELLIKKYSTVLSRRNEAKRTPYQERLHQLEISKFDEIQSIESATGRDDYFRKIVADDPIAAHIRSFCVRRFARDKIMECLYHPGQERHIEFDLGGLPHATISEDYLDRLSKHLRFESILKYVALPRLRMESPPVRGRNRGERPPPKRGLSDLVAVFNWLRQNKVEKIVKVMVIDDGDPSHADASIEEALKGFGVELWDWKRLDLSSDVISTATTVRERAIMNGQTLIQEVSVVKEISLYSSGNQAILMGWASPWGLPNKRKFPQLKKVKLYIREGLEDRDRLWKYISNFKDTIERDTDDRIQVTPILDNKDVSYASEFKSGEGFSQSEHPWIDCLGNFARLLRTAPVSNATRPVKIAVIDDGVDASLISLDGKIALGKSFCYYTNSTDQTSPYYVPSGNHGTCMATLISKICPQVSLFIARLDERQATGSGQRRITAKSAAEAIRWATECGVDIISMSWTIETPVTGNEDMELLKKAVQEAAAKEILMFCSTSDQGNSTKDTCYPGDFEGCIKIGGATETGEALSWVNADKVEFLLPGKDLPFPNNEGKIISHESGSSVATAAASGLAGLLIFCGRLVDENRSFQDKMNMREAFRQLASQKQFPHVQDFFDNRFKRELVRLNDDDQEDKHMKQSSEQKLSAYSIGTMDWDDKCKQALKAVMERLV